MVSPTRSLSPWWRAYEVTREPLSSVPLALFMSSTRNSRRWWWYETAAWLRDMALRAAYGGYRVHQPGKSGSGVYRGPLDASMKATWPALVDEATFRKVRELLLSANRRTSRPGRGVHLLSMIAGCEVCSGELTARYKRGDRIYVCRGHGCVAILADELDGFAETVMLAYLAEPDVIAGLRAAPEGDAELTRVRGDLEAARGELLDWQRAAGSRKVSAASFAVIEPPILARISELETRERELRVPPALSVIPPGKDVARRWQAAPMSARRQAARMLCSPPILGTLLVGRTPTPGRRAAPVADRVAWGRDTANTCH